MLSEDEKKAIENLNEILKEWQKIVNIKDKTEREIEMSLYMEEMPFIEIKTVLNLVTKLQKEVEHQKEKRENQKVELAILNEKQKDMNKLINTVKSYKGQFKRQEKEIKQLQKGNEEKDKTIEKYIKIYKEYDCYRWVKELEKKDKQIDLMAEMIDELSEYYARYWGKNNEFCKEECIKKDIDCKDCIKQYFEKLAKEKGE